MSWSCTAGVYVLCKTLQLLLVVVVVGCWLLVVGCVCVCVCVFVRVFVHVILVIKKSDGDNGVSFFGISDPTMFLFIINMVYVLV